MNAPRESFQAALASAASRDESRHAALLLHTLAPADRHWLLEQLPADERRRLETLVAELGAIGIPPAPELLDDLAPARARPAAGGQALPGLARAAADDVAAALAGEPAELLARVMALGAWPWIDEVLARIPAPTRQQVVAARSRLGTPVDGARSALDKRLAELVEARVQAAALERAARQGIARPSMASGSAIASGAFGRWLAALVGPRSGGRRS